MTAPALLFSFLLASLYGVAFYFIFGRGWLRLGVYWLVALAGFAFGQALTSLVGLSLLPFGSVNVIEASVTSLLFLVVARMIWSK